MPSPNDMRIFPYPSFTLCKPHDSYTPSLPHVPNLDQGAAHDKKSWQTQRLQLTKTDRNNCKPTRILTALMERFLSTPLKCLNINWQNEKRNLTELLSFYLFIFELFSYTPSLPHALNKKPATLTSNRLSILILYKIWKVHIFCKGTAFPHHFQQSSPLFFPILSYPPKPHSYKKRQFFNMTRMTC